MTKVGTKIGKVPTHLQRHCFTPGNSGNPKGRPKRKSIEDELMDLLAKKPSARIKKILKAAGVGDLDLNAITKTLLFEVAIAEALTGDFQFYKLIMDRVYGKVPERVADPNGDPIPFTFVFNQGNEYG